MRRKTVSVNVGIVDIGSNHSIKTQSMTTASTLDTNASVEEAIRIRQNSLIVRKLRSTGNFLNLGEFSYNSISNRNFSLYFYQ